MPLILDVSRDGDGVVDHDDHATIHVFATVIMTLLSSVLGYAQHPVRINYVRIISSSDILCRWAQTSVVEGRRNQWRSALPDMGS